MADATSSIAVPLRSSEEPLNFRSRAKIFSGPEAGPTWWRSGEIGAYPARRAGHGGATWIESGLFCAPCPSPCRCGLFGRPAARFSAASSCSSPRSTSGADLAAPGNAVRQQATASAARVQPTQQGRYRDVLVAAGDGGRADPDHLRERPAAQGALGEEGACAAPPPAHAFRARRVVVAARRPPYMRPP